MSVRRAWVLLLAAQAACAPRQVRDLQRAGERLDRAARQGDAAALTHAVIPPLRPRIDVVALQGSGRSRALGAPVDVRPEALVFVAHDRPVAAQWTDHGWRFVEDPLALFDLTSPRAALRALVRATREGRWDVLLGLAPERYRIGLSEDDLRRAWTEGEGAAALIRARDRLAERLDGPIWADAHEAAMDLGDGLVARLEREGARWVVVDF